jgi:hypothetical protein
VESTVTNLPILNGARAISLRRLGIRSSIDD